MRGGRRRLGGGRREGENNLGKKGVRKNEENVARAPLQEGRKEVRERGGGKGLPPCPPLKDVFRCVRVGVGSARKRVLAAHDVGTRQQA